jgi:hypothetical protein
MTKGWYRLSFLRLRGVLRGLLLLGTLVVSTLAATACAAADVDEQQSGGTSSTAATIPAQPPTQVPESTPKPTPTFLPTWTPVPTPSHKPGYSRSTALGIGLGEVVSSSFSFSGYPSHYYEFQFEKGTTYIIEVTLGNLPGLTVYIADERPDARFYQKIGEGLPSSFDWTAEKSGSHFFFVDGSGYGNYTMYVTDPETARAQTPSQSAGPGVSPTASPSGTVLTFASVSAGGNHTCGVTTSGAAYCWGWDFYGQLGNGSGDDDQLNPVPVSGGLSFASVSAGSEHTCGVTTSGAAYCWGIGSGGQLGNGTPGDRSTPVPVSGGHVFASVSANTNHSCGVTTSGAAFCWGKGFSGQLGNGSQNDHPTPVAVSDGLTFASIDVGGDHTCGVATNGTVYC